MPDPSPQADARATGIDRRQLALVALCLVGLVVAAFLVPPPVDPGSVGGEGVPTPTPVSGSDGGGSDGSEGGGNGGSDGGGGTGGGGGGDGTGPGGSGDGDGGATGPGETGDGGGDGTGSGGSGGGSGGSGTAGSGGDADDGTYIIDKEDGQGLSPEVPPPKSAVCSVVLRDTPVPGTTVTVTVLVEGDPAAGVPVSFDGQLVGPTDATGNATGPVPYERELDVSVTVDGVDDCRFYRYGYDDGTDERSAAIGAPRRIQSVTSGSVVGRYDIVTAHVTGLASRGTLAPGWVTPHEAAGRAASTHNFTGTYTVPGAVNITVVGDPYPRESVTVVAAISGVPMPDATVTLDGERVGRTDDAGRHDVTLPETDVTTVTVSRGEFNGTAVIDVRDLTVGLASREGLAVPGERVRVNASVDGEPVDAPVRVDGTHVAETTNGTATIALPTDPTATVTVETERLASRASVIWLYLATLFVTLVPACLAGATLAGTHHVAGAEVARRLARVWAVVGVVYAAYVVGELVGLGLAILVVALGLLYRYRSSVKSGGHAVPGLFASLVRWSRRAVWVATVAVERAIGLAAAAARRLAKWLGSLPPSATELVRRLAAWVAELPARLLAVVRRRLTVRRVLAVVLSIALVGGMTVAFGSPGFVAGVLIVLGIAAVLTMWRRRSPETGRDESAGEFDRRPPSPAPDQAADEADRLSLRELWRRFARWVVPGRWRTRTPAEVSRAAVDRGFPREPVETLTETFREVEYGDGADRSRRERAREAFRRLAGWDRGEETR